MIALILNSGMGSRMGVYTSEHPKCMSEISADETIIKRQIRLLHENGITDVIITTGYYNEVLVDYCKNLPYDVNYTFVYNPIYNKTNYIYSIYCAREYLKDQDVLLLHGDLVFEASVLRDLLTCDKTCMKVSSTLPLPEKDFKAVVRDGRVYKVGVEFFEEAMEAQALYKLNQPDWSLWLERITDYCENDKRTCYAEAALNEITDELKLYAFDVENRLCSEIDTPEDWAVVKKRLAEAEQSSL